MLATKHEYPSTFLCILEGERVVCMGGRMLCVGAEEGEVPPSPIRSTIHEDASGSDLGATMSVMVLVAVFVEAVSKRSQICTRHSVLDPQSPPNRPDAVCVV